MAGDPHERTERVFRKLIEKASDEDVRLLLEGMSWLGTLIEEVGIGIQNHSEQINCSLTEISDRLVTR